MSGPLTYTVAPARTAPVDGITCVESVGIINPEKCEMHLNIGLFFDGTDNNRDADKTNYKESNIVRLWYAYQEQPSAGYFRIYVPGVGTKFPDVRESGNSRWGAGFGVGCEARVLYGLLMVFNAIHQTSCNGRPLISKEQIPALCCNSHGAVNSTDAAELAKLGQASGLLMSSDTGAAGRERILISLASLLESNISNAKPRVTDCFIDVFGFSRGAAQARVFCNWLNRLVVGGSLAGIRIHFRFLGIMDTVASAGVWDSVSGNGHGGWADPAYLRIPSSVTNCVHMVAVHELRKNFPLDTVSVAGVMPGNCSEFAYPGSHSDVGGGYLPGQLGISVGKDLLESDALKLAQIPLNHMFDCAVLAGAPLSKKRANAANVQGYDCFAIAPALQAAYDEFLDLATMKARPVKEWLQLYLNWRWDRRLVYSSLGHVLKANDKDRALLIKFNDIFLADIAVSDGSTRRDSENRVFKRFRAASLRNEVAQQQLARSNYLDEDANTILHIARQTSPDDCMKFHTLFDGFVHDSLAGFDLRAIEMSGHLRYRKGFLGSDTPQVVEIDASASTASMS